MREGIAVFYDWTHVATEGFVALIFYFFFYSFMGWLIENVYSLITTGVFMKEGFLYSPLKPMYGFAPIFLLYIVTPETHLLMVLAMCLLVPTTVEYVSGLLLEKFFNRKWWDYSSMPYQISGHVCLLFSFYWLVLSLVFLYLLHPMAEMLFQRVSGFWYYIYPAIITVALIDILLTLQVQYRRRIDSSFLLKE
ncbi:putative ABC transporter permease [Evansella tamaricis]|uniref:ABC transporter permease n=1 Tax=Evansella tamaricis TaxID=2069301 RepID=A0ABS6JK54_9BACI|nr:putative ABC transporter permease [Evansella tamaricis]MBU9714055.1 putative ABC transporter permease [Evansella tamaricis]